MHVCEGKGIYFLQYAKYNKYSIIFSHKMRFINANGFYQCKSLDKNPFIYKKLCNSSDIAMLNKVM